MVEKESQFDKTPTRQEPRHIQENDTQGDFDADMSTLVEQPREEVLFKVAEHFNCAECKESLFGKKYILNEDVPHCIECFEAHFCNNCEICELLISCTSKDLSYKDRHWHSECFLCSVCSQSLTDQPFTTNEDKLMCIECFSQEFSAKCHACLKTIMPGSKKMEHKGNSWHENCFTCDRCQQLIGTNSFVKKDAKNVCLTCYEKLFSLQCIHCEKPLMSGGVSYRDQPWHKECFVCNGCQQQLAGQRFTSRDDLTYCLHCFCNLFFKKCVHCTKPIGNLKGSNYVSFEQRQWHTDCFSCRRCSVSLVGKGFLTYEDEILCPSCGKDV